MRTFERLRAQHAKALDERKWKRAERLFLQMHDDTMARLRSEVEADRGAHVERQMVDDDIFHASQRK